VDRLASGRHGAHGRVGLRKLAVVLFALIALAGAVAGDDPPLPPEDPPPPTDECDDTFDVCPARVRCESLDDTRVLDREVWRGRKGYVRFRIVLQYRSTFLYARRPGDHHKSYGRDFGPKLSEPPGVYHVVLPLEKGRWEVTCVREVRNPWDHVVAAFSNEFTVVRRTE
jgi:hypothetical protein